MNFFKRLPTLPIKLMRHPVGLMEGRFAKVLLVALLLWVLWGHVAPQTPDASPVLKKAVAEMLPAVVEDLSRKATAMKAGRIVVLHLGKDDSQYVTAAIRGGLFEHGVGQQLDRSWSEKTRGLLGLDQTEYTNADRACPRAGRSGRMRWCSASFVRRASI